MNVNTLAHPLYFSIFPQGATVTARAHGIDLSKYDLFFKPETATGQLDFVVQRVSYRNTRDEAFDTLLPGVLSVPIHGGYHYLNSDTSWRTQADRYLNSINGYIYHFNVCDLESSFNVMSKAFAYEAWNWIHYVEDATGKPTLLYTSPSTYKDYVYPSQSQYGIDWNTVDLWQAQWFFTPNPDGTPSNCVGRSAGWKLWQYTDKGHGPTYGVSRPTACDLDVFNGSVSDMQSWLKINDTTPPPPPTGETPMNGKMKSFGNIRNSLPNATPYQDVGDLPSGALILWDGKQSSGNYIWYHIVDATYNGQPVVTTDGRKVSERSDCWTYGPNVTETGPVYVPPTTPPPAQELPASWDVTQVAKDDNGAVIATYKGTLNRQ